MKSPRLLSMVCWSLAGFAVLAADPIPQPNTLRQKIEDPNTSLQSNASDGVSVAFTGDYAIVGCFTDDLGGRNAGVVKVYRASTGALLYTISVPNIGTAGFGRSVAVSGNLLAVGAPLAVGGRGTVYVFDLASPTPTTPIATLTGDSGGGSSFGLQIAISGTRVAARQEDPTSQDHGIVLVYDLASSTPTTPLYKIQHPVAQTQDSFGDSLALDGDRLVVSAPTPYSATGTTYVYNLTSATPTQPAWTLPPVDGRGSSIRQVAVLGSRVVVTELDILQIYDLDSATPTVPVRQLISPNPQKNDAFGHALALAGQWLVVGAYTDDARVLDAGRAYVFDLADTTTDAPLVDILNPNAVPGPTDWFGYAVAISGTRVLVSAIGDCPDVGGCGSTYVYDFAGATPGSPLRALRNAQLSRLNLFGTSVAISGQRMVVGSPGEDAQRVDIFDLAGATPFTPVLTFHNPHPSVYMGSLGYGATVAIAGNWVVVGDQTYQSRGCVHVYNLASPTPSTPVRTLLPTPPYNAYFGRTVAISGTRVVVAAPVKLPATTGRAYVFDLAGATPQTPVAEFKNPVTSASDNFSAAVAISGTRVLVGAPLGDIPISGGTDAGLAYLYDLSTATPTTAVATLQNPNPSPSSRDEFGGAVAILGTRGVVGAPNDDGTIPVSDGATYLNSGRIFVYDFAGTTPAVPTLIIGNPLKTEGSRLSAFGGSLSISGTRVAVGAMKTSVNGNPIQGRELGSAYVFDLASSQPGTPVAAHSSPTPTTYEHFGNAVAIDGTTLVIGAAEENGLNYDRGAIYLYDSDNVGPAGGSLALNPSPVGPGKPLTVQFSSWIDATPPLNYAVLLNDVVISPDGTSLNRTVTAPTTVGLHTLKGRVTDAFGNVTLTSRTFTIWPTIAAWRASMFGAFATTDMAADLADPDGDGLSNHFEYTAGLSPQDPASRFVTRVEAVAGQPSQRAIKFGPISPACTYVLKTATTLSDGIWTPLQNFTTSDIGTERTIIDLAAGDSQRFYRVEIQAPPGAD